MSNNEKNKKTLAVFFGLMPGAGHMYLGLQKQGLQLMTIFFLGFFLTDWLRTSIFMIVVPLVWFYSFFDVMHKASLEELPEDTNLMLFSWLSNNTNWNRHGSKFVGYTLIIIGIISLFERVVFPLLDRYINWEIRNFIQTVVVAAFLIFGGIKLIIGSKKEILIEEGKGDEQ